jgi:hypothetical protein
MQRAKDWHGICPYLFSVKGQPMKTMNSVADNVIEFPLGARRRSTVNKPLPTEGARRQPDVLLFLLLAICSLMTIGISAKQLVTTGFGASQQSMVACSHSLPPKA